jgi:hypothetical protein
MLMVVKGLQLPEAFVRVVNDGGLEANDYSDDLDPVDAYGNPWSPDLVTYINPANIEENNRLMEKNGRMDPNEPPPSSPEHCPGFIPYIDDYSQIVCFGENGMGEPYCFDFRENPEKPSIIQWYDVYWRRVAPDFETLLTLLDPV